MRVTLHHIRAAAQLRPQTHIPPLGIRPYAPSPWSSWETAPAQQDDPRLTFRQDMVILMTMSETRSLADVKAHLSELVAQVGTQHERVTVTVHGRPAAVLVAVDDLESLEETIALLADSDMVRALTEADAELAAGKGESEETLRAAMRARQR